MLWALFATMTLSITAHGAELWFSVRVQPRASRNAIVGETEGVMKLSVTSPPVEGEANEAVRVFIAKALGVPKRAVRVVHGEHGRDKVLAVEGVSVSAIESLIATTTEKR